MIKIELKNVHHAAFASEETHCFDAVLHVDGKKVAIVSNQGHGGPDHYSWVAPHNWDTLKAINERIVADYPLIDCTDLGMPGHTIEPNLECVVGDLVNAWLVERDLKRSMARKVLFTKPNAEGIYEIPLKQKGRVYTVEAVIASLRVKEPGRVFLNELPLAEAVALFRRAA